MKVVFLIMASDVCELGSQNTCYIYIQYIIAADGLVALEVWASAGIVFT